MVFKSGFLTAFSIIALSLSPAYAQETAGDPAAGERVFRQCAACHTFNPDQRRSGPHLYGLFGRTAGAVEGFRYSNAMAESGIVWTDETLGQYLLDPTGTLPGTSMRNRLRREETLADLLAYMRQEAGPASD